jgi:hypothetical protein
MKGAVMEWPTGETEILEGKPTVVEVAVEGKFNGSTKSQMGRRWT